MSETRHRSGYEVVVLAMPADEVKRRRIEAEANSILQEEGLTKAIAYYMEQSVLVWPSVHRKEQPDSCEAP
mgnify:CR=1 FL=1